MFGIEQWDSGLDLLVDFLIALAIFAAIFIIVRRVDRNSRRPEQYPPKNVDDN